MEENVCKSVVNVQNIQRTPTNEQQKNQIT